MCPLALFDVPLALFDVPLALLKGRCFVVRGKWPDSDLNHPLARQAIQAVSSGGLIQLKDRFLEGWPSCC